MKTKLLFIFMLGFLQNGFAQLSTSSPQVVNKVAAKNQVNFLKACNNIPSQSMTKPRTQATITLKSPEIKTYVYDMSGNESVKKKKKFVPTFLRPTFKKKSK